MIDLNRKPYFDDYDENKGFHRILYRPSHAIQARELNQMQTILQQQIRRFGNHMFKNGSMIKPGGITYDGDHDYVKVHSPNEENLKNYVASKIIGGITLATAEYIYYIPKEGTDPAVVYIKPTEGGNVQYYKSTEYTFNYTTTSNKELVDTFSKFIEGEIDSSDTGMGVFVKDPTIDENDTNVIYFTYNDFNNVNNPQGIQSPKTIETVARQINSYVKNGDTYQTWRVFKRYNAPVESFIDGEDLYLIDAKPLLEKALSGQELNDREEEELMSYRLATINLEQKSYDYKSEHGVVTDTNQEYLFTTYSFGKGAAVTVEEGYYYINGYFVKVQRQTLIIDKYNNEPTVKIGLRLYDTIVTPEIDETLNDNAVGAYNYAAPGAHRYKMDLKLEYVNFDPEEFSDTPKNPDEGSHFIILMTVVLGNVTWQCTGVDQEDLERILARRTFDESGNYTVTPFTITPYEHLRDESDERFKNGKYYFDDPLNPGNKNKIALQISTGKAYVKGFERGKNHPSWIDVNKARAYNTVNNESIAYSIGNYCYVTNLFQLPNITNMEKVTLYNQDITRNGSYNGSEIGTARIRGLTLDSGSALGPDKSVYCLYLFDVKCSDFSQVKAISGTGTSSKTFTCSLVINTEECPGYEGKTHILHRTHSGANIFRTQNAFVKSMAIGGHSENTGDTTYTIQTMFNVSKKQVLDNLDTSTISAPYYFILTQDAGYGYDITKNRWTLMDMGAMDSESSTIEIADIIEVQGNTGTSIGQASQNNNRLNNFASVKVYINNKPTGDIMGTCPKFVNECKIAKKVLQYFNNQNEYPSRGEIINTPTEKVVLSRVDGHSLISIWARRHIKYLLNEPEFERLSELIKNICSAREVSEQTIYIGAKQRKSDGSIDFIGKPFDKTVTQYFNEWNNINNRSNTKAQEDLVKAILNQAMAISLGSEFFPIENEGTYCYNVTDHYSFHGGQTDAYYDYAYLTINTGFNPPEAPMIVNYTFFEHAGDGHYFCIDSYKKLSKTGSNAVEVQLDYEQIPTYTTSNGVQFSLADCLDFRPIIDNGRISAPPLYPNSTVRYDYQYYLARIDKICIDWSGKFIDVEGKPDINPIPPDTPPDAMHIWTIYLAPYTRYLADIRKEYIDNRRYTMRDIGKLEKRIDSLEYYVSLSLLEIQTLQMQITDSSGANRFKNGFIVDPFDSHNIGESEHSDYKCSIDSVNKELRPTFATNHINMKYNEEASSNLQRTGALLTLPWESISFIEQPKLTTTCNVNPFAVRLFGGELTFQPDSDSWYETTKIGTNTVDYSPYYDALNTMANTLWDGKHWGDWYLTGSTSTTKKNVSTSSQSSTVQIDSETTSRYAGFQQMGGNWGYNITEHTKTDKYLTTTLNATTTTTTTTTKENYARSGWEGSHTSAVTTTDLGDKVVGMSDIQYMRSIPLMIKGSSMKPNTRVYPFFDDVDVSEYCTPCPVVDVGNFPSDINPAKAFKTTDTVEEIVVTDRSIATQKLSLEQLMEQYPNKEFAIVLHQSYATTTKKDSSGAVVKDSSGKDVKEFSYAQLTLVNINSANNPKVPLSERIAKDKVLYGMNSGGKAHCTVLSDVTIPQTGSDIITSKAGTVALVFNIPNNNKHKFRTGERVFVLTDQQNNTAASQTKAEGKFVSRGYDLKTEGTILSTKTVQLSKSPISDKKTETKTSTTSNTSYSISTNTFDVVQKHNTYQFVSWGDPLAQTFLVEMEGGVYITAISVVFASKDESLPITCKILECDVGTPTQRALPYSASTLYPDQIEVCPDFTNGGEKIWTRFEMEAPVYLEDGGEYAILLMTDSFDYNVYVAELGNKDLITGQYISSQPYNGVFFKSQNSSTWMQDQDSDLTFKIERAKFDITQEGIFYCDNEPIVSKSSNAINIIETFKDRNSIRLYHDNHGLSNVEIVRIKGFDPNISYNGLPGSYFNPTNTVGANTTDVSAGTFSVSNVEIDSVLLTPSDNQSKATMDGRISNAIAEYCVNIPFDVFKPSVSTIVLSGTSIDWKYHYTSQISVGGVGKKEYIASTDTDTEGIPMVMNADNYLKSHGAVRSENNNMGIDDKTQKPRKHSLRFMGKMKSTKNNISPIIDLNRCSAVLVNNKVDYPELKQVFPKITFTEGSDKLAVRLSEEHGLSEGAMVYWDTSDAVDDLKTIETIDSLTGKVIMTQTIVNPDATVFPVADPNEATVSNSTLGQTAKSKNTMYAYSLEGWYNIETSFTNTAEGGYSDPNTFYITLPGKATQTRSMTLSEQTSTTPDPNVAGWKGISFWISSTHHKYIPENKSKGASTASRYFTKKVSLDNPSTAAKIMFTCACTEAADFEIWVKTQTVYETRDFEDIDWVRVNIPEFAKQKSKDEKDYKDYEATLEFADGSTEQEDKEFVAIAVKIVMKSRDQTQVPVFKNLRVICLAT